MMVGSFTRSPSPPISPEKDQRSDAIGRVKVGCRSGAYVGYFAVKLEILC